MSIKELSFKEEFERINKKEKENKLEEIKRKKCYWMLLIKGMFDFNILIKPLCKYIKVFLYVKNIDFRYIEVIITINLIKQLYKIC